MVAHINDYRNRQSLSLPAIEPCSIEAEEAVLGSLLLDPSAYSVVENILGGEMFYVSAHAEIYRTIQRLNKTGEPADLLHVSCSLQDRNKLDSVGGMVKLTHLLSSTISAGNIDRFAKLIIDKWARRQMIHAGRDLADISRDQTWETDSLFEFVDRFYDRVRSLKEAFGAEDKQAIAYNRLVEQIKQIEQNELDPGLRTYKLAELARKTGTSTKFLSGLYLKYLSSFEIEPSMTLSEMKAKYGTTTQEWMLHGFGPAGSVVLLHAHGGVGKTRLIYDWIYAMATGQAWEGHHVTADHRRVLMVQTDESQGDTLTALDQRGFTDDMPIKIMTRWTADHMAGLRKEIEAFRPEVILIDSLTSINRNSMFSENDTEYARPVLELRDLAQEFGCLIYLVHHSNSQNGSRGTKAITASVSHVFSLHRPSEGASSTNPNRILCVDKSRCRAPGEYELVFNPETGGWTFNGEKARDGETPSDDGSGPVKEQILAFLTENRNVRYESSELVEIVGGHKATINRALSSLSNAGLISRAKVATNQRGKPPTVYWVAWNKAHEGIRRTPENDAPNYAPNSKPDSVRVSEVDAPNSQKKANLDAPNSESFCKTSAPNAPNTTGQGFEFGASPQNELDAPPKITINADPNPPVGHFSQSQLEDMIYYEMDRLGWTTPQVQAVAHRVAGNYIESLDPGQIMNVIYALRKED
ncbi:AAA family ATPase [Synechocystis sp. PCC 7339]|uniref:AAA family ATPase n=1 Tax=Synechocystis sp. PCC 7339 TaxID=2782213 RepID=UPI001CC0FC2F|nr:DnaB-like helicase N-terminal domain-containing protein [Synechocystis sp. PCC 7339]UAJ73744.1 AAA family ATPase [Synechocystis sp. PCC 7339]